MTEVMFSVGVENDFGMTVDEIWPDGDAPENPTTEDVLERMATYGSLFRLIREWSLDADLDVTVNGRSLQLYKLERQKKETKAAAS